MRSQESRLTLGQKSYSIDGPISVTQRGRRGQLTLEQTSQGIGNHSRRYSSANHVKYWPPRERSWGNVHLLDKPLGGRNLKYKYTHHPVQRARTHVVWVFSQIKINWDHTTLGSQTLEDLTVAKNRCVAERPWESGAHAANLFASEEQSK